MTGLETVLISGGAQWIITKLADEVHSEVSPRVKAAITEKHDLQAARKAAKEEDIDKEFRRVLRQFEDRTGVSVDDYDLTYPADSQ